MVHRNNDRNVGKEKRLIFSLGSNLGDRLSFLKKAISKLEEVFNGNFNSIQSEVYETAAWGLENQEAFLNQILIISGVDFNPRYVLENCLEIEKSLGRERTMKWGPRLIDIDILFFENEIVNDLDLVIPHPQIQNRRFILAPLASLLPLFVHPILNKSMLQLFEECTDSLSVKIYSLENIVNHKN